MASLQRRYCQLILFTLLFCRVKASSNGNVTTTTSSWSEYFFPATSEQPSLTWSDWMASLWEDYFQPPPKMETVWEEVQKGVTNEVQVFQETLERNRQQLEADVEKVRVQVLQQVGQFQSDVGVVQNAVNQKMRLTRKRLERGIRQHIFLQRVGWDLFLHSILNHIGLILGASVLKKGYKDNRLAKGASALQVRIISWQAFEIWSPLPHTDVIATAIGLASLKISSKPLFDGLSTFFLVLSLFQTMTRVLDDDDQEHPNRTVDVSNRFVGKAALATVLSLAALRAKKVPFPLVAASVSGAALVCESIAAEVTANGYIMLKQACWVIRKTVHPLLVRLMPVLRRFGSKWVYRRTVKSFLGWEIAESTNNKIRKGFNKLC